MWGRKRKSVATATDVEASSPLKQAVHQARIEAAERSSVVVDLRDAEVARLELLNEALDPLFAEIPPEVDLFDRGFSRGETPRLWIDAVAMSRWAATSASIVCCRTRASAAACSPKSHEIPVMVKAVTDYVARRLVERERAIEEDPDFIGRIGRREAARSEGVAVAARSACWCSVFSWGSLRSFSSPCCWPAALKKAFAV